MVVRHQRWYDKYDVLFVVVCIAEVIVDYTDLLCHMSLLSSSVLEMIGPHVSCVIVFIESLITP